MPDDEQEPSGGNTRGSTAARLSAAESSRLLRAVAAANEEVETPSSEGFALPGYTIEREVGSGGGGRVYKVRRGGSDRPLALKVLYIPLGDPTRSKTAKRAWRELDVLADLHLPCLPRVVDYGTHEGRLYIVTDWIDGLPIDKHCDEHKLDRKARVALLAKAADAVQTLHEHGVIHRDLKPSNILVDSHGNPMIVDFGLAALLAEGTDPVQTLSTEGAPLGTPAFMSPEQARGERVGRNGQGGVTTRSDVYSLGATGYFILTGNTPHDMNCSLHEAIRRVAMEGAREPRELDRGLPKALAAVLTKACAVPYLDRYESAAALGDDLRRWLRGEPVAASSGLLMRAGRWVRRHPILVTAAICIALPITSVFWTLVSLRLLYHKPSGITLDPQTREVRVLSRAGGILHTWPYNPKDTEQGARIIARPDPFGGGDVAVTLLSSEGDTDSVARRLSIWKLDELDQPVWSAPTSIRTPESNSPPDAFNVQTFLIADVIPHTPGEEIVVVHAHHCCTPWVVRVYDFGGQVRYERWNWGPIRSVAWSPDCQQLVCTGENHEHTWLDGRGNQQYQIAVFALKPEVDDTPRWVSGPLIDAADRSRVWYRWLTPRSACETLRVRATREVRQVGSGRAVCCLLWKGTDMDANFSWWLDARGTVCASVIPDQLFNRDAALGELASNGGIELRDEPPVE